MKGTLIFAASLLGVAAFAQPASAENIVTSTDVAFDDLDLTTKQGQRVLDYRLAAAVRKVCGSNVRSLAERRLYDDCAKPAKAESKRAALQASEKAALAALTKRAGSRS